MERNCLEQGENGRGESSNASVLLRSSFARFTFSLHTLNPSFLLYLSLPLPAHPLLPSFLAAAFLSLCHLPSLSKTYSLFFCSPSYSTCPFSSSAPQLLFLSTPYLLRVIPRCFAPFPLLSLPSGFYSVSHRSLLAFSTSLSAPILFLYSSLPHPSFPPPCSTSTLPPPFSTPSSSSSHPDLFSITSDTLPSQAILFLSPSVLTINSHMSSLHFPSSSSLLSYFSPPLTFPFVSFRPLFFRLVPSPHSYVAPTSLLTRSFPLLFARP